MWARVFQATVQHPFDADDLRETGAQVHQSLRVRHGYRGTLSMLDAEGTRLVAVSFWDAPQDMQRSTEVLEAIGGVLRALGGDDQRTIIDVMEVLTGPTPAAGQAFVRMATLSTGRPMTTPELVELDTRAHAALMQRSEYRGRCLLVDTDARHPVHLSFWQHVGDADTRAVRDVVRTLPPADDEDHAITVEIFAALIIHHPADQSAVD
jgi:hypothetical protein